MFCPNCGAEISTPGKFCPECGKPVVTTGEPESRKPRYGDIRIDRDKSDPLQSRAYSVIVDGESWGKIKRGDCIKKNVRCGRHTIRIIDRTGFRPTLVNRAFNVTPAGVWFFLYNSTGTLTESVLYPELIEESVVAPGPGGGSERLCPRCGGTMTVQSVTEANRAGCLTTLWYIFLFVSVIGWLVLIPLLLRSETKSATYAICQSCGYKERP